MDQGQYGHGNSTNMIGLNYEQNINNYQVIFNEGQNQSNLNRQSKDKLTLQQKNIEFDTNMFQSIQKEYLYEIDFNKQTFEKRMNFHLKQYQDIVRYYYSNKLSYEDFQKGIKVNNQLIITGEQLKHKFISIIRNTVKRLEQYLANVYQKNIVSLSDQDLRQIYSIVMRNNNLMSQQNLNTLGRAMKMCFDLPVKMQEAELVDLYSHFLYLLQEKLSSTIIQKRLLFKNEVSLSSQISQIEKDICDQYVTKLNINHIREKILQKYENNQQLKEYKQVDFYFILQRILRKAFLKLKHQYSKFDKDHQHPLYLHGNQYIYLIRSKQALPFRFALITFFKKDYIISQDIYQIVQIMKHVLQDRSKILHKQVKSNKKDIKNDRLDVETSEEDNRIAKRRKRTKFTESEEDNISSNKSQSEIYQPNIHKKKQANSERNKQLTLNQSYIRSNKNTYNKKPLESRRRTQRVSSNYLIDRYKSN